MSRSPVSKRISLRACRHLLTFAIVSFLVIQQLVLISPPPVEAASADIVISQVYGGGGNSGATYKNDFIELYNRGSVAIPVTGWSVQYASSTGNTWQKTDLTGTIQPGEYYLVQEAVGTGGTLNLPSPSATGSIPMSATTGKVALVTNQTLLTCGNAVNNCFPNANIKDFVGFGTANNYEGTGPTPAPSNTTAVLRAGGGTVDTDNNAADFSVGAPNPHGTDTAPTVASTAPAASATNVAVNANITVTFSEAVDATGNWFTISCGTSGGHTAAVSGGATSFTLNPDSDFLNGETCTVTVLAAQVKDQDTSDPPDNMTGNYSWSFTTLAADPCTSPYTPIPQIQGSGSANTLGEGVNVTLRGIVTGDFQTSAELSGFFVQDAAGDGNPLTSDGIFVFVPAANSLSSVNVVVGDDVVISGKVKEFNTLTEIDNITALTKCGTGSIAPTVATLPETVNGDLERYEGMLVTFPQTLTAQQNFFQGRYGQVSLGSDGRLFNPTNSNIAGSPGAIAQADENARRVIVLDDGRSAQNPNPIPYIGADNTLRAGDTVAGLTGLIDFGQINSDTSIRDYRLHPTVEPTFTRANQRTAAPDAVGGNVRVASFNVLNYFNGNGTGLAGAAGGFPTERGATTLTEFNRQRAKIIAAITAISPDVVGLMELENDGGGATSAIQNLVDGLNAATAPGTYAAIVGPDPGTDAIQVGLIYKPGRVTPVGAPINDGDTLFERHPLAQTFSYNTNLEKFTVIVNHFKSKSSCPSAGDPNADQGDGQGCWNVKRVEQAQALLGFISTVQAAAGDTDVLVIGDLNSYGKEDPVVALTNGGLIDQIERFIEHPYSYVFDHQAGYLDHALATSSLSAQVSGVTEWHINADEPSVIDYNTEFKPQDLYTPTPYRSSDHDPVIVGLDLNAPPTANAGGPYSVNEGGSVMVSATGNDPDGGTLTYDWDLDNDNNFETPGQSATFSAAGLDGPTSRTIQVRVTDQGGLSAISQATVNVQNVAPQVAVNPVAPVTLGSPVSISGSFTDAGTPDTHTAVIDWGDGTTSPGSVTEANGSGTVTGSHTYSSAGSYTVVLTVTDDDGAPGTATTTVNVSYGVISLFDQTKEYKSGSTIPVKLQLVDAAGNYLSSAGLVIHVTGITLGSTPVPGTNWDSGNANPGNDFRFVSGGYIFNLSTKNLPGAGVYTLHFTVSGDPVEHTLDFIVQ